MKLRLKSLSSLLTLILTTISLLASATTAFAHGGEDHGDEKTQATQSGANMIVRVTRSGDYEVAFKHPILEPDKEISSRLFITRYENNEPISSAKVVLLVAGNNGNPIEVAANSTDTPGLYEIKLPPMPQGDYKFVARVDISGSSLTADLGSAEVKPSEAETPMGSALWARSALIALVVVVLLGLLGALLFVAVHYGRRARERSVKDETVAA